MSHPNVELAAELVKCTRASDPASVELLAVAGKRKGLLILDASTQRYTLTPKGNEFVSKWKRRDLVQAAVSKSV